MKKLSALLLILTALSAYSQTDSVYKYNLPELKITQSENGKDVIYDFNKTSNIFLIQDSTLYANPDKYKYKVPIADIKKISILYGNKSWRGAKVMGLVGGGLGLVTGIMASLIYQPNFAEISIIFPAYILAGVLAGGIVGGILGTAIPHYEEYSKYSDDIHAKKEILKRIFKKHNLR